MRKKYQVFISSTYEDLRQERQVVTWALLKARYVPVGMEAFSATDDRGWKTISATIDDSDYYILILAGKLGSLDKETGKSWTRREYEYARSKGIPVLAFIRDPSRITQPNLEFDLGRRKMVDDFTQLVHDNHHREEWTDEGDLVHRVTTALNNHVQDDEHDGRERPGWFRGDQVPSSALEELARLSKENSELREALAKHNAQRPIVELLSDGQVIGDKLLLQDERVELDVTTMDAPTATYYKRETAGMLTQANGTVWLALSLRNGGGIAARTLTVEVQVKPAVEIVLYPQRSEHSLEIDKRLTDPTSHVYVDRFCEDGNIVQRIKSINAGGTEPLVNFGLPISPTEASNEFQCEVRVTEERGQVLEARYTVEVLSAAPVYCDLNEIRERGGKPANRVVT